MPDSSRIQVLLHPDEAEKFDAYCRRKGYKKSTLIARLVREHLERESLDAPSVNSSRPFASRRLP